MTEAEWRWSGSPLFKLAYILDKTSTRKLRLFAHACCLRSELMRAGEACRRAADLLERSADGLAAPDEVDAITQEVRGGGGNTAQYACWVANDLVSTPYYTPCVAESVVRDAVKAAPTPKAKYARKAEERHQARLLDDIFGPVPFRHVAIESSWLTPSVVGIAGAIYARRAFHNLPILADALEDAGCADPDVLSHCRSKEPHVRGCWTLDLLLARK